MNISKLNIFHGCLIIFLAATGMSCSSSGSGGDGSGTSVSLNTVSDLPQSTSAVEDGSNNAALVKALGSSSDGMPLGSITEDDFDSDNSLAACEMFNMTKSAINEAAMGDLIFCYVSNTFDSFANQQDIDIYDGDYHVFSLDFTGSSFEEEDEEEGEGGGGPDVVKFRVIRNSDQVVTRFEMFACTGGEQEMYLNQVINGTDFSSRVVNIGSHGGMTYSDAATITGTLNAEGDFVDEVDGEATPKVIHMQHQGSFEEMASSFWGDITFSQSSDSATLTGTMSGSNTFEGSTCDFSNVIFGSMGLLDGNEEDTDNYNIGLLELGDGIVKGQVAGSCSGDGMEGEWDETFTEAWLGSSANALDDASDSDYYDDVADATLSAMSEPSIIFSGDEAYDCNDTPEMTIYFGQLDVDVVASCSNLELNHEYIDCWHIIDSGGGENEGGDEGGDIDLSECNGDPQSTDPVNDANIQALCQCIDAGDDQCSGISNLCAQSANMGACVDAINEMI